MMDIGDCQAQHVYKFALYVLESRAYGNKDTLTPPVMHMW